MSRRVLSEGRIATPYLGFDEISKDFRFGRCRAFWLPHVSVARITPGLRRHQHTVHRVDAALLGWLPWLKRFAGRRVFEIVKETA